MALAERSVRRAGGGVDRQAAGTRAKGDRLAACHRLGRGRQVSCAVAPTPPANLFLTWRGRDCVAAAADGGQPSRQPAVAAEDSTVRCGVMAAVRGVRPLAGVRASRPSATIVAVAWMNEEGSRFAPGMMGSGSFCRHAGRCRPSARCAMPTVCRQARRSMTISRRSPTCRGARSASSIHAYIEPHIEQNDSARKGRQDGWRGDRHPGQVDLRGRDPRPPRPRRHTDNGGAARRRRRPRPGHDGA